MVLKKLLLAVAIFSAAPAFAFVQSNNPILDGMVKPAPSVLAKARQLPINDPRVAATIRGMTIKLGSGLLVKRSVPALMIGAIATLYAEDLVNLGHEVPTKMGWTADGRYKVDDPSLAVQTNLKPYPATVDALIADCGVGKTCYYSLPSAAEPIIQIFISANPYSYNPPAKVDQPGANVLSTATQKYWQSFALRHRETDVLWIWKYYPGAGQLVVLPQATTTSEPLSLADAVAKMPASTLDASLAPQLTADTLNELWRQASLDPNYRGLPFDASRPIKASDIDPSLSPTVRDFTKPLTDSQIEELTAHDPSDQNIKPEEDSTKIDLGDDPATPKPELEKTPTGIEIFSPIAQEGSKLQVAIASRAGECPKPQFNLFNQTQIIDAHCNLMNLYSQQIRLIMLSVFAIAAFFIVLRA